MNPTIDKSGNKSWYNKKGLLHKTDGPAIEHANGDKYWYQNGIRHRTDGPAREWADGDNLGLGFDLFISERIKHESSCY